MTCLMTILTGYGVMLAAEPRLHERESAALTVYLDSIAAGAPSSPDMVDRFAELSEDGLFEVVRAYAAGEEALPPHTQRAYQDLLERTTRPLLHPWAMVQVYAPRLGEVSLHAAEEDDLVRRLFSRLMSNEGSRRSMDLAVRLAATATLAHLASGESARRVDLLEAWDRRLWAGRESRPIPKLHERLAAIADQFSTNAPPREIQAMLRFVGGWPQLHSPYDRALAAALEHDDPEVVKAGLNAQQRRPARLDLNAGIVERWLDHREIVQRALRNFAYDEAGEHAAVLRDIWPLIPEDNDLARYDCLFAMGVHPSGNAGIALDAVLADAHAYLDVAVPILAEGDPALARKAVAHVLGGFAGADEEALRLAHETQLRGFEQYAVDLARDPDRSQMVRQTALQYLRITSGDWRREMLDFLAHPTTDLRLAAIQMFGPPEGLSEEDMAVIGPQLMRVAINDEVLGHRQEAMYVLGQWRHPQTVAFFEKVLAENPPVDLRRYYDDDAPYWQYRFRLMALLGLAKLDHAEALRELVELHETSGPAQRMDVLLAFLDMGRMHEMAFEDLDSREAKLVATAATLIRTCGSEAHRRRLRERFAGAPLWKQMDETNIDDHRIPEIVELSHESHSD